MSDIKLHHSHELGLAKARQLTQEWMDDAARRLGLNCQLETGQAHDTVTFERMGIHGSMVVSGDSFDLQVKLGMMMSAFKPMIEAEIERNLQRAVERASGERPA